MSDNPCVPCTQEINPCYQCGCTEECSCAIPDYTNETCPNGTVSTGCVIFNDTTDTCVNLVKNTTTLSQVISRLITYIKNVRDRIINTDGSLNIIPIDDSCDDKVNLSVRIDPDNSNILELRDDGLFVENTGSGGSTVETLDSTSVDFSGDGSTGSKLTAIVKKDTTSDNILQINSTGLYVPPVSSSICSESFTDVAQENTTNQSTYDFLIKSTSGGCSTQLVSPPTGFAVTGNTRVSAFGKMEWYATLALANTAASTGETVLIYNDTVEDLNVKNGVNYFGVGYKAIGNVTATSAKSNLSGLSIIGDASLSGDSVINTSNVNMTGNLGVAGTAIWRGGNFLASSQIVISSSGIVQNVYTEGIVAVYNNGSLFNSVINFTQTSSVTAAIVVTGDVDGSYVTVKDCSIYSLNIQGLYAIIPVSGAGIVLQNVKAYSPTHNGIYLHRGNGSSKGIMITNSVVGISDSASGVVVVLPADVGDIDAIDLPAITGIVGMSKTNAGISGINISLKNCHGISDSGDGIVIGGAENRSFNSWVIECTGESNSGHGLIAYRDIYISGGTFISKGTTSTANPIYLTNGVDGRIGYTIAGVKTISHNNSIYSIAGDSASTFPIVARISGCQFLNQNVLTGVLGIDTANITLRAVTIDAYGNIT